MRVGVALDPLIEDEVSSSDESWWYVHQAITLLVQYPTALTGGRTAIGVFSCSRPDSSGPKSAEGGGGGYTVDSHGHGQRTGSTDSERNRIGLVNPEQRSSERNGRRFPEAHHERGKVI